MKILEKYVLPSLIVVCTFAIGMILDYLYDSKLSIIVSGIFVIIGFILLYLAEHLWTKSNLKNIVGCCTLNTSICIIISSNIRVGMSEFRAIGYFSALAGVVFLILGIYNVILYVIGEEKGITKNKENIKVNFKTLFAILIAEILIIAGIFTYNYIEQKQYEAACYYDNANVIGLEFIETSSIEKGNRKVCRLKVITSDNNYDDVKVNFTCSSKVELVESAQYGQYYEVEVLAKEIGTANLIAYCPDTNIEESIEIGVVPEE